jgi:phage gpG-like protein
MKVKDNGLQKFEQSLKQIGNLKVRIGAVGVHDGGISNAELLAIHEFGTSDKRIPARMPVRSVIRDDKKMELVVKTLHNSIQHRFKPGQGLPVKDIGSDVGNTLKELIKNGIRQRLSPPLAESTLKAKRRKGYSSVPLIATGQLMNSIDYDVSL